MLEGRVRYHGLRAGGLPFRLFHLQRSKELLLLGDFATRTARMSDGSGWPTLRRCDLCFKLVKDVGCWMLDVELNDGYWCFVLHLATILG